MVIGVDPVINPSYMGDYDMVGVDNANFYPVWGDNSDFNPVDNRFNANIRTATVSVNAGNSPEVITTTPTGPTAGPVSSVRVTFNRPIFLPSFTPSLATLTGPGSTRSR